MGVKTPSLSQGVLTANAVHKDNAPQPQVMACREPNNVADLPRARHRQITLALMAIIAIGRASAMDPIIAWNAITESTVATEPDPATQLRSAAITQIAVFEAVNSIVGDYEPFLCMLDAPSGASPEAAAIAAAHHVLTALHPAMVTELDQSLAEWLAALADSAGIESGIQVGVLAAETILASRVHDGFDNPIVYTPGTRPGDWEPTPPDFTPAFRPGLGDVAPFAIKAGAQFRVKPPPPIHSGRYARAFNEVKEVGRTHSTERPEDRAVLARFYEAAGPLPIHFPAARQMSLKQGKTLSENARIFAMVGIAIFDAAIACFESKYHYNYWRPVTAIRAADQDGNPRTVADHNWAPFVFTPPFPSYPSGHATFGGAARRVLEHFYGEDGHSIVLTHPALPEIVLHYATLEEITDDIDDGRVFGGVHYRFDQEAGARQGWRVGDYILRHVLRPVRQHGCDGDWH